MMIAINCNWIQISIVSWIRDILVRIRIRRSLPLTYGSGFILGSGSGFESGFRYRILGLEKHRIRICNTAFSMYFYFFLLVDGRIRIQM